MYALVHGVDEGRSRFDEGAEEDDLECDEDDRHPGFLQEKYGRDFLGQNRRVETADGDVEQASRQDTDNARQEAGCHSLFPGFDMMQAEENGGKIPFPDAKTDRIVGGHAVVAVGYNDKTEITNKKGDKKKSKGAFLIRNSWGKTWGDSGYGWLPYDYVLKWNLASDWWTLIKQDYIDLGIFD